MKGDLVALYVTDSQIEIIQITDTPYTNAGLFYLPTSSNAEYTNGGRGVEGTTAQDFAAGVNVVKLEKYERKTTLLHDLPATQSDRATEYKARTPNTSDLRLELTLRDADLVSPKLDYFTMMRIGTEFFVADSVDGSLDAFYAVKMSKQIRYPNNVGTELVNLFGGGNVTIHQDVEIYSGALRMYGSDGKTLVMAISNDDGHSGDGSIEDPKTNTNGLTLKGPGTFYGDLKVYYDDCQMNGICSTETSFRVSNREGNVFMGEAFYQKGKVRRTNLHPKLSSMLTTLDLLVKVALKALKTSEFITTTLSIRLVLRNTGQVTVVEDRPMLHSILQLESDSNRTTHWRLTTTT